MAGQGYRGGFCEKLLESSPCLTEPMLVGSRMDPPLAKAEPTSDGSNAPGVIYFRRGKKNCGEVIVAREEGSESM